jgi:hypothetical protein
MKFGHATLEDHRPLADSELDAVSGGMLMLSEPLRLWDLVGGGGSSGGRGGKAPQSP